MAFMHNAEHKIFLQFQLKLSVRHADKYISGKRNGKEGNYV